jgi:tetratricopeptide (TPR) repeat protein
MKKLFSKKEIFKVQSLPYDPASMGEPTDADGFRLRGTAFYARKEYQSAAIDLDRALAIDSSNIDSFYTLGMVYKAMRQKEKSVAAFTRVLELIRIQPETDKVRNAMLRRLALGHINAITQGDWNLEKEIWQRTT